MTVTVRLFARARDLVGADSVVMELPAQATAGDLRRGLATRYPPLAGLLARSALAIDNEFAEDAQPLPMGVEVAVLPPVSGG
jgi:molybdopterin synthase sulfur carrier subunit